LPAGHAVDGVVDKEDGDVLAAVGGMDDLAHADAGEVAVALVGDDDGIVADAADGRGHRRGAAVGALDVADVEIVVGKDRAAHR
jgi:hypothetical protein